MQRAFSLLTEGVISILVFFLLRNLGNLVTTKTLATPCDETFLTFRLLRKLGP